MRVRPFVLATAAALAFAIPALAETPQQSYQDQQDQYQRQMQQYREQHARYEDRLDQYEYDRAHPASWWRSAYFHAVPDWYYGLRGREMIGSEVSERDGRPVGRVDAFERAPDGRIERVEILLSDDRATWVDVSDIRYDRADGVVFVDLTPDELYDDSTTPDDNYRP